MGPFLDDDPGHFYIGADTFIEAFNGSPRDELPNEETFDSLADARCKRALW